MSKICTIFYKKISAEKSYHSFFILALMHATIFGNVASIISRMYSKRQEYDKKVLDLEHFVKVHKLPKNLKQR